MLPLGSLNPESTHQMGHSFRTLDPYLIYADRKAELRIHGEHSFFQTILLKVSMSPIKK